MLEVLSAPNGAAGAGQPEHARLVLADHACIWRDRYEALIAAPPRYTIDDLARFGIDYRLFTPLEQNFLVALLPPEKVVTNGVILESLYPDWYRNDHRPAYGELHLLRVICSRLGLALYTQGKHVEIVPIVGRALRQGVVRTNMPPAAQTFCNWLDAQTSPTDCWVWPTKTICDRPVATVAWIWGGYPLPHPKRPLISHCGTERCCNRDHYEGRV